MEPDTHTLIGKRMFRWKWARMTEFKVLAGMALALLIGEVAARQLGDRISADLRHIDSLNEAPARFAQARAGKKLLIVGNSLARNGIDRTTLESDYGLIEMFVPDGSSITEWSWGVRKFYEIPKLAPDEIWLMTGRAHLLDLPVVPEKIGGFYVAPRDLGAAIASEPGREGALRLFLGWSSDFFAIRDRLRPIVGYGFLPGFEAAWPAVAAVRDNPENGDSGAINPGSNGDGEIRALRRFVGTAESMGARVRVVAVPLPRDYDLPKVVVDYLGSEKIPIYDFSHIESLGEARFPDGYHLDHEGAEIFTEDLKHALQ